MQLDLLITTPGAGRQPGERQGGYLLMREAQAQPPSPLDVEFVLGSPKIPVELNRRDQLGISAALREGVFVLGGPEASQGAGRALIGRLR